MKRYEMVRIMAAINSIDGDCYICSGRAAVELVKQFPDHRTEIEELYTTKYGQHTLAEIRREWLPK